MAAHYPKLLISKLFGSAYGISWSIISTKRGLRRACSFLQKKSLFSCEGDILMLSEYANCTCLINYTTQVVTAAGKSTLLSRTIHFVLIKNQFTLSVWFPEQNLGLIYY
jgi:hypothetical protein